MSSTELPAATADELVFPSEEVSGCPFATYHQLREEASVHGIPGRPEYVVSRYEDIVEVLHHPEVFSSETFILENGVRRLATLADRETVEETYVTTFQAVDPPKHTWKRKLASQHFRPGAVHAYEPIIRSTVDALIDDFAEHGRVEFISEFARPVGARATMLLMGLPADDAWKAEPWGRYDGQATPYRTREDQDEIAAQVRDMHEYVRRAVKARYENPRDDVLSHFIAGHVETSGPELGLEHARFDTFSVLLGGMSTSAHLVGNMMMLLLRDPEATRRARAERSAREGLIEETLRLESPVQWNVRMALRDYTLGETMIEAGTLVMVLYGSGNRDERHFPEPETLDLDRANQRSHLAFGHGLHFCLGAPLARLAAQLAFERLLARVDNLALAGEEPIDRAYSYVFRGLTRMDLTFDRL